MTRQETAQIMEILKAAYPRYYSMEDNMDELKKAVALWADMFRDDNVSVVAAAVKSLIASDVKGFPPVIGQVKEKIRLLTERMEESEMEAWKQVIEAVRAGPYEAEKEFKKLPEISRRIVGSPATLNEWGMMDSGAVHTVVASNFQRSYRAIAEREKEINALPEGIRQVVERKEMRQPQYQKIGTGPERNDNPPEDTAPIPESVREALKLAFSGAEKPKEKRQETSGRRSREEIMKYLKGG